MNKNDVFMIIAQIYFVGAFLSENKKGFLNVMGTIWLISSFIAWIVK